MIKVWLRNEWHLESWHPSYSPREMARGSWRTLRRTFEDDVSWLFFVEAAADFPTKIDAKPAPKRPFKNLGRERFSLLSAMNGGEKSFIRTVAKSTL